MIKYSRALPRFIFLGLSWVDHTVHVCCGNDKFPLDVSCQWFPCFVDLKVILNTLYGNGGIDIAEDIAQG